MRTLILFVLACLPLSALTVDEVVELAEAGVADDIIIDQMKADGSAFELSAREIVNLQKKKVSPAVIRFMVQARGKAPVPPAAGEPTPIPLGPPIPSMEEPRDAALTVRNLSAVKITVIAYPHEREIALVRGEISSGIVLANGSHSQVPLPSGLYRVRWTNEAPFRELAVTKDVGTELEFRDDAHAFRHVKAYVLVDGQEEPDPNAPKVTEAPETVVPEPRVYQSPTNSSVTVIRDVVQAPTRVVIAGRSACDTTVGWADGGSYYVEPAYRPGYSVGFSWGSSPTYYRSSCAPTYYHGGHSYHHGGHSYHHGGHSYYHGGHSYGSHGHHYSRTADNVQYYLRWPFGHRHR